jgi:hypothetical protein
MTSETTWLLWFMGMAFMLGVMFGMLWAASIFQGHKR